MSKALRCPVSVVDELQQHMPCMNWVLDFIKDPSVKRVHIVGHHDNLIPMIAELNGLDVEDVDMLELCEVRRLDVNRKSGEWTERWRYSALQKNPGASLD